MIDQLFDPSEFASPADSGGLPRKSGGTRKYRTGLEQSEPSDGSWAVISNREGPLMNCHRIDRDIGSGSVITKCGQTGRAIDVPRQGTLVIACQKCREAK